MSNKGNKCCCDGIDCVETLEDRCLDYGESNSTCGTVTNNASEFAASYVVRGLTGTPGTTEPGIYERPIGDEYCTWFNVSVGAINGSDTPYFEPDPIGTSAPVRIVVPEPGAGTGTGTSEYFAVYYPNEYVIPKLCPTFKRLTYDPLCSHLFAFSSEDSNLSGDVEFLDCLCVNPCRRCCDDESPFVTDPVPATLFVSYEYCDGLVMKEENFTVAWDAVEGYWIGTFTYDLDAVTYYFIVFCGSNGYFDTDTGSRIVFDLSSDCEQCRPSIESVSSDGCSCMKVFFGNLPPDPLSVVTIYDELLQDVGTCVCDPLEIIFTDAGGPGDNCGSPAPEPFFERFTVTE